MKAFWKVLGFAALAAGLTPYKVEKNEETGEKSYQALLWRITSTPDDEKKKIDIGINLGEGTLTSKLMAAKEKKEEPHLFSDELCVEYAGSDEETAGEAEETTEIPEIPEIPETPVISETPEIPEVPEIPETPEAGEIQAE